MPLFHPQENEMTIMELRLITADTDLQPRVELSSEIISEYSEDMKAGVEFPPIIVFRNGEGPAYLADGFHRFFGAKKAGLQGIPAEIRKGGKREALLYSVGANATHGMRRTNADKRRAVMRLLSDPEWKKWSDRKVAEQCGVDHGMVASSRQHLADSTSDVRLFTKGGVTAEMNTENMRRPEPIIERYQELFPVPKQPAEPVKSKPTFNRTNDNIEWASWSWNPVTGCLHGCDYCYARDIANRFYPEKFKPTFHPDRLTAPENTNPIMEGTIGGRNVFVCSMADLFGKWVPEKWIAAVFEQVAKNPQWNFLFLTKFPQRLAEFAWPKNAWCGTTVDTQARVKTAEKAFAKVEAGIKWLSCEPMMERLTFGQIEAFNWIVIGGASASTKTKEFQPPWDWILHLCEQADHHGIPVYFKPNLKCRKEYPDSPAPSPVTCPKASGKS
jgi:protein gp37